jgi:hypothetical protein
MTQDITERTRKVGRDMCCEVTVHGLQSRASRDEAQDSGYLATTGRLNELSERGCESLDERRSLSIPSSRVGQVNDRAVPVYVERRS